MSDFEDKVIALAASAACSAVDCGEGFIPVEAEDESFAVSEGAAFVVPTALPLGIESGDGRKIVEAGKLSLRNLPIPLYWQIKTGQGHDGSVIVGRVDELEVDENGSVSNARGVFDTGVFGREAERLVRNKMMRGISADLDMFETLDEEELAQLADDSGEDVNKKLFIKSARVMALTLLGKPAFQECELQLVDQMEDIPVIDGVHSAEVDLSEDEEAIVSTLIAGAIPVAPPREWFNNPELKEATPITVSEDGRVFGHIATWSQDHISFNYGVRPPRSKSNYAYFHTGLVKCDDSTDVTVGQLTLAGGHADLSASAADAAKHYDDTASAIADVHAGEDAFGIWVSGALRPNATPEQIRVLRASAPSGDWRPIDGRLELVAVCQVNVPGFPVARACVASGMVTALVAAGAGSLYKMRTEKVADLANRLDQLEKAELQKKREMALASFAPVKEARQAALIASAEELRAKFAPHFEARDLHKQELAATAEELRNRVSEFKFYVRPKYIESQHPRDRMGRWIDVLGRLSDILGGNDSNPAAAAVKRAVDAEENGDDTGAVDAGREAKEAVKDAIEKSDDPETKAKLGEIASEVQHILEDPAQPVNEPGEGSSDPITSIVAEGMQMILEFIVEELAREVDPKTIIDRAFARLKQWVDGSHFENPEEIMKRFADLLQKQVEPNIVQ
jgi:hypothetical protein